MKPLARSAFWLMAAVLLGGTGALVYRALRRQGRVALRPAPVGPAEAWGGGHDEPVAPPAIEDPPASGGEREPWRAPGQAVLLSEDGRWETWAPRVPVRHVTSVVLAIRALGADGAEPGVLACSVKDPEGGRTSRQVDVRNGGWTYLRYPHDFYGAALHRPGEYRVTWTLAPDGPAVAHERFEVVL